MNNSVAAYAPKSKTYSLTDSLLVRIGIAAGIQILGYHSFWSQLFFKFDLELDANLDASLRDRDTKKLKRNAKDNTKEGKLVRGRAGNAKLNEAKKRYLEELRTGMAYESGIAVANTKRDIKNAPVVRNPFGTSKDKCRCKYFHPDYCTKWGHTDARNKECYDRILTPAQRGIVLDAILR